MPIYFSKTEIAEIVSNFYDKSFSEKDIENKIVTEEMVRFAILCEFEVIHKNDFCELYEQYSQAK